MASDGLGVLGRTAKGGMDNGAEWEYRNGIVKDDWWLFHNERFKRKQMVAKGGYFCD
jgi:hypothetical protein